MIYGESRCCEVRWRKMFWCEARWWAKMCVKWGDAVEVLRGQPQRWCGRGKLGTVRLEEKPVKWGGGSEDFIWAIIFYWRGLLWYELKCCEVRWWEDMLVEEVCCNVCNESWRVVEDVVWGEVLRGKATWGEVMWGVYSVWGEGWWCFFIINY